MTECQFFYIFSAGADFRGLSTYNSDARAVTFEPLNALGDMEQDLGSPTSVFPRSQVVDLATDIQYDSFDVTTEGA